MDKEPTNIPELTIELLDDSADSLIRLGQSCSDELYTVDIHPIHLRYMVEKFGLVATSEPMAQRTIATLTRRLLLLRDRIEHLDDLLSSVKCYPPGPRKYSTEEVYSDTLLDLANEFCAELVSADFASETGGPE